MSLSNNIAAFLNFLAFMCSIPIIASSTWLASKPDNECIHSLRWPVVFIGIAIMLVSLTGFIGAYWKKEGLLGVYLVCMALLIVLLLVLLVLAFVVTGPTGAYMVPGRAYREYRLEGFSYWLRNHITGPDNWRNFRTCLADSSICLKLNNEYVTAEQFFAADLSPTQSGCCKPPTICGYQYMKPTLWINPSNAIVDADCSIWNNDPGQLCYKCDSCKAGLLGNLRKEWRKSNLILIVTLVILIWVYLIGCCAYKNTLSKENSKGHK
ncbi:unnamed protein product [Withania somnifera]